MSMRQVELIIGKWKMRRIRRLEIFWLDMGRASDRPTAKEAKFRRSSETAASAPSHPAVSFRSSSISAARMFPFASLIMRAKFGVGAVCASVRQTGSAARRRPSSFHRWRT